LFLKVEDIFEGAVEAVGPQMRGISRIDQLGADAHATAGLAHRAFQNITHPQFAPDLFHIDGLALVGEARIASDDEEPADARQRRDDLLDHAVGEILLLGIAAHIGEGQHRDRRFVRQRERCLRRSTLGNRDAISMHRAGDVLDLLLALVLEREVELVAHLIAHNPADADPAGFGQGLEARGDVDAVAVDVALIDDDVTDIDADAKLDAPIGGRSRIARSHFALHLDRTAHRVYHAAEFDQHAVAGGLDDPPTMLGNLRIDQFAAFRGQSGLPPHGPNGSSALSAFYPNVEGWHSLSVRGPIPSLPAQPRSGDAIRRP
jgi:hypothetical protein